MRYGNHSPWKKYLASPITIALLLVVCSILIKASTNLNKKSNLGAEKLQQAQAELQKLKDRQSDLTFKVEHLSSDEGLESEIRAKYRAVKDGESVAVIVDDEKAAVIEASTTPETSFWRRLLQKIGL